MTRNRIFAALGAILSIACPSLSGQQSSRTEQPESLIVVSGASEVERRQTGLWNNDGCDELKYTVSSPFPGNSALNPIADELRRQGWIELTGKPDPSTPSSGKLGVWEHFRNAGAGKTYQQTYMWKTSAGDHVTYQIWYSTPAMGQIHIEAYFCDPAYYEKRSCFHGAPIPHDECTYSLALKIKRIEPDENNFKVYVDLTNTGLKPVQIGVNGQLKDGAPELWVLGVEQQDESGEWESVDAVCPEHPAFDWITLKPGEDLPSWALAVDFPNPNQRFAVCRRKAGHLHGKIRAYIRYYVDACDIENPFGNQEPYFATSDPVALPVSPSKAE
jgi:hypothetical protein